MVATDVVVVDCSEADGVGVVVAVVDVVAGPGAAVHAAITSRARSRLKTALRLAGVGT